MVLEIPGKLFGQDDVRETESAITEAGVTSYLSIRGVGFHSIPAANWSESSADGFVFANENGVIFTAPVDLPNGATITAIVVYGSISDESWSLFRTDNDTQATTDTLATANINTEDTTISNATVDNKNYAYFIATSSVDTNDEIWGARITYTT